MKATNKYILLILISVFTIGKTQCQIDLIDSLKKELIFAKQDTNHINLLVKIAGLLRNNEPDSAIKYANRALVISKKINSKKGLGDSWLSIGSANHIKGNFDSARFYYNKSIENYEPIKYHKGIGKCLNNIGNSYNYQANFDSSIVYFIKSLETSSKIKDTNGISIAKLNIGNIYLYQSNYQKAIEFYEASIKIDEKNKNESMLSQSYNNMGAAYRYLNKLNLALSYYSKSLIIRYKHNNKEGIAENLLNIGDVYHTKKNVDSALINFNKALEIYREIGHQQGEIYALNNIASAYILINEHKKAISYLNEVITIATKIGSKDVLKQSYLLLADLYEKKRDFKQAYYYVKKYSSLKDSIFSEENSRQINELEEKFEAKEKENQILILNQEKSKQLIEIQNQKHSNNFLFGGIIFSMILVIFILIGYIQKQKANLLLEEKNNIITLKKEEIEFKNNLLEEKHVQIQQSIGYAKRIQTAIIPPESALNQYLNSYFILYQPKDVVAGDFYWLEIKDDDIFLAAADCTGHGVPGAMVSVVCHSALNRCVREYNLTTPSQILDKTRELVLETFQKSEEQVKDGMDISLLKINFKTQKAEWAGANNPLYLLRHSEGGTTEESSIEIIKPDKQPIGFVAGPKPFTNHILSLSDINQIYLFTDGYADQFGGEKGKKMGYNTFREKLLEISDKEMNAQKDILNTYFSEWKGKEEQIDDVCVIGIKI